MSQARYGAYKGSGVEWLGEVPAHWAVGKLKDIAFYQEGPGIMADDFQEEGVPLIRISGMKGSTVSLDGCNFLDPIKVSKRWPHFKLKLGELLVSASATTGIAAKVNESVVGAIPYTGLIRFKPRSKLCSDYLQYFLTANIFTYQIDLQKSGTTIQHYGPTHLGRIFSVLPPLPEQTAIAVYLDEKTAQLDRKIELLVQKAEQYGKLKQSLINEAVTRGLDKAVAMKDSGVEWIGEVPAHWEVKRGKDVFEQTKNKVGLDSSSYNVLSLTLKGVIKRDLDNMKGKIPASFDGYQIANPDNLVLCLFDMDVTPRIVGYVGQLGIITSAYTVLRGKRDTHMKYFLYYYLEQNRNGSLLANSKTLRSTMTFDLFSQLQLPVPPLAEQQAIAAYLDEKTAHIDRIVATINTQIDKLKELRKTLINDIVTGKICIVEQGGLGALTRPAAERG